MRRLIITSVLTARIDVIKSSCYLNELPELPSRACPVDGKSAGPHATKTVAVIDFPYKYKHYY